MLIDGELALAESGKTFENINPATEAVLGCPRMLTNGPQLDLPLENAIRWPAKHIEQYPWVTEMPDGIDPMGSGRNNIRQVWKEPVGVVGAITPWNFPIEVILNKVGQALATGNTMVLKVPEQTPLAPLRIGELLRDVVPPGVLNIVTAGREISEPLVTHKGV